MPTPPPTPAERCATLLACLGSAVAAMGGGGRLRGKLIALLIDCIRELEQGFARLAAAIQAGTCLPRRDPPRRPPAPRPPPRRHPLSPSFGSRLPPVSGAAVFRSPSEVPVGESGMAEPTAAAPARRAAKSTAPPNAAEPAPYPQHLAALAPGLVSHRILARACGPPHPA